jgi:CheY-like chemotaxis protein
MARIVLVEDNDITCYALAKFLRNAGHEVAEITDSKKVFSLIEEFSPDLVVTDIVMPDVDGIEVINHVRENHGAMPVIAISGGGRIAGADYLELAGAVGATATLEKPFDEAELMEAVDKALAG